MAFGLSLEADWVEQSLQTSARWRVIGRRTLREGCAGRGGSVFTEILREEMQRTFEHAERYRLGRLASPSLTLHAR